MFRILVPAPSPLPYDNHKDEPPIFFLYKIFHWCIQIIGRPFLWPNWNKFCSKKCRNNRSLSKIYLWHFSDWHFWGMTQSGNQKTITNVVSLLPYWLMNWTDWMQLVNHQHFLWSNTISHYKSIFTTSTFIYTNNVIIFNKNCIKMKIN